MIYSILKIKFNVRQTLKRTRLVRIISLALIIGLPWRLFAHESALAKNAHGVKDILETTFQNNQDILIKGRITDDSGSELPGVHIAIKGTTLGTMSDAKGNYSIEVGQGSILVFSFLGYATQELEVKTQTEINIVLQSDITTLNEVVVIGYGTTTKKEVTGAIASLKEEDFNKGNIANPVGLLQGKVAGLNIVKNQGGDPNGGFQIQLRGLSSLSGGTGPLIVIDGVLGGDLNSVNVEEIESIDVLKDGSAAAIYGTRGTNGVIIITTKGAKAGETSIEFSTYISTQTVSKKLENLTAGEFRQVIKDYYPGREAEFDHGSSTDWFKEITRTPVDQYYNLAMSGGTDNFSYRAAINYRTGQGIVEKNDNDRLQAKMSLNQKGLDKRLNIDYNLIYAQTNRRLADPWALQMAFRFNPTEPVYDADNEFTGGYYRNAGPFEYYNPVAMINERQNDSRGLTLTGNARATFEFIKNLKASVFGSVIRDTWQTGDYKTRYYPVGLGNNGSASKASSLGNNKLLESNLEYKNSFGDHNLQIIGGYSYQENIYEDVSAYNFNFDTDFYSYNNIGAGYGLSQGTASMTSSKESNKLIAFFGRALYNYDEKYLLSIAVRQEGSSRFGKNQKWGTFPAVSVGWRVHKENFMSGFGWLNDLKLRAGYGVTGNQDIGNYRSLQLLGSGGKMYYKGQWINTYPPASNPNPNLKWEKKSELNFGIDFGVFENRLSASIDYYNRLTSDLLWWYSVPVPPNVYNSIYANVGDMRNKGFEITLNAVPVQLKDFTWKSTILYNRNRNELVSFSDKSRGYELTDLKQGWLDADLQTWTHQILEGGPIGNFVAPVFLGIDENGNGMYKDKNADGNISDEDREIVGNAFPKFQLSFNNTFIYRNFDLSIFLRGVYGNSVLNVHRMYYENFGYFGGKNILRSTLDHPEYKGKAEYSSRYVEKASYLKLDNVAIGYNLPLEGKLIKKVRIYATGQQLLTFTKYKGVDPEISLGGLDPGVDTYDYYPRTRTFTAGVNLNF